MEQHRRYWLCEVCNSHVAGNRQEFAAHLKNRHGDDFTDAQLQTLLKTCSRPRELFKASECVLCDWEVKLRPSNSHIACNEAFTVSAVQFLKHLASHLERIALFSLPRMSTGEEGENSTGAALGASAGSSRAWVRYPSPRHQTTNADRSIARRLTAVTAKTPKMQLMMIVVHETHRQTTWLVR